MSDSEVNLSRKVVNEAVNLCEAILDDIELSKTSLSNIVLKTARLCRLIGDFEYLKIMQYEASGYPSHPEGMPQDLWSYAVRAGRNYKEKTKDKEKEKINEYIYRESIGELEGAELAYTERLRASQGTSISSEYAAIAVSNIEAGRNIAVNAMSRSRSRLESRRAFIYNYVINKYYELKLEGITSDIISNYSVKVDSRLTLIAPESSKKFVSIYENLNSDNEEDWSNAVHSCRRILQELADTLFPPIEDKKLDSGKIIKLGVQNYVNRLIAFVESRTDSDKFRSVIGSHLKYIGERLDAVYNAANKGSHETITDREEAERYVIYTYLIVGDILTLVE
ncbi:hypothetical protein ACFOPQ_13555 [Deinococcus antarcticus]|uniref:AbiTii domain-containing protein n=1 Tax=Deinococcus antarcticus TaxID=1298767 RepID=A0ABV8ABG9_9DEIO